MLQCEQQSEVHQAGATDTSCCLLTGSLKMKIEGRGCPASLALMCECAEGSMPQPAGRIAGVGH